MSTFLKGLKVSYLKSTAGLLHLANDQSNDAKDFGFVGEYKESNTTYFSGLIRDHSSQRFVLFDKASDPTGVNSVQDDADTTIKAGLDIFDLHIDSTTNSDDPTTGALTVAGGVGIAKDVHIGGTTASDSTDVSKGALTIAGGVGIAKDVYIGGNTTSYNSTSGALVVAGGVGIGDNVFINSNQTSLGGPTSGALVVVGGIGVGGDINVANSIIAGTTLNVDGLNDSTDPVSGALVVAGGVGIAKDVHIGGTSASTSSTTGALVVAGGVGIGERVFIGSNENSSTTDVTKGALVVAGGAYFGSDVRVTGDINMDTGKTVILGKTPQNSMDAATKAYVDSFVQGLDVKASVRVKTTAADGDITLSSPPSSIDGVPLVDGDRVLLTHQAAKKENGIYVYAYSIGLLRAPDASTSNQVTAGLFTFVEEGATYMDTGWVLATNNHPHPIILDTDDLEFVQFSSAGLYQVVNYGVSTGLTNNYAELFKEKVGNDLRFYGLALDTGVASGTAADDNLLSLSTGVHNIVLKFDQSKLTGVGDLTSGTISAGFGDIKVDNDIHISAGHVDMYTDTTDQKNYLKLLSLDSNVQFEQGKELKISSAGASSSDYITIDSVSPQVKISHDLKLDAASFSEAVQTLNVSSGYDFVANPSSASIFILNASSANVDVYVSLPACTEGRNLKFIRSDTGSHKIIIKPQSGKFVNGELNGEFALELQYEHVKLTCVNDALGWITV